MWSSPRRVSDFRCIRNHSRVISGVPEIARKCSPYAVTASSRSEKRTWVPRFYQVHLGEADFVSKDTGIRVLPFHVFCSEMQMP